MANRAGNRTRRNEVSLEDLTNDLLEYKASYEVISDLLSEAARMIVKHSAPGADMEDVFGYACRHLGYEISRESTKCHPKIH